MNNGAMLATHPRVMGNLGGDGRAAYEGPLKRLELWIESHNYEAYEPFDGLSSHCRQLYKHVG